MDDGYGQKLYQTVEMYADDQGTNRYVYKIKECFLAIFDFQTIF